MKALFIFAALGAGLTAAAAFAATETPAGKSCFYASQWSGWKAPNVNTMYMRMKNRDVYEVGFASGCRAIRYTNAFLVSVGRGQGATCTANDLDIRVAEENGRMAPQSCIATSLRKLSAEESAALPEKDRP